MKIYFLIPKRNQVCKIKLDFFRVLTGSKQLCVACLTIKAGKPDKNRNNFHYNSVSANIINIFKRILKIFQNLRINIYFLIRSKFNINVTYS